MVVGSGRSRGWDGRALALGLAMACVFGLDGCSSYNPFTLYRDLTGASKDDPPKDAANTANLEAGSQEPYPAAGSVPNPPTRGLTESQREKLAQGLVADRANAHYIDEQVTAGNVAAVMAPQAAVPRVHRRRPRSPNAARSSGRIRRPMRSSSRRLQRSCATSCR